MRTWARSLPALLLLLLVPFSGCIDDVPGKNLASEFPLTLGDPLANGALDSVRSEWNLGTHIIEGQSGPYLVHIQGSIQVPEGDGSYPVVLLMHGRHSTCATPVGERLLQPCPNATPVLSPVDSYKGYDYLAQNLASHGYVVLSVDANNVNDRDNENRFLFGDDLGATARARIIHQVLLALTDANAGTGEDTLQGLTGRLDLTRVGLMGHSRGGEGVSRAWAMARDEGALPPEITIRAVFALAPSDFDRQDIRGVPFAVLLPYCDGDMYDLSGSRLYDDARNENTAPMHQFLTMGANHNYYNTIWTRSDWGDRDDPWCDESSPTSGRDTPTAQRLHGVALMNGFFRHYLGAEANLLPMLTGQAPWPVPGVVTSYHPADAQSISRDVIADGDGRASREVAVERCDGEECPAKNTYTSARQTAIRWVGPSTYRVDVRPEERDLSFRIGLDPETVNATELQGMGILVRTGPPDTVQETYWTLAELGAFVPPGEHAAKTILNTIHVPLPVNAKEVVLTFDHGRGVVQVADWIYVEKIGARD